MRTTCLICGIQDKPCQCATKRALEERTKEILEIITTMRQIDSLEWIEEEIKQKYGL